MNKQIEALRTLHDSINADCEEGALKDKRAEAQNLVKAFSNDKLKDFKTCLNLIKADMKKHVAKMEKDTHSQVACSSVFRVI